MPSLMKRVNDLAERLQAKRGGGPIGFAGFEYYEDDPPEEIAAKRQEAEERARANGWRGNGKFWLVEVVKQRWEDKNE